ncbi:MAG: hypothetical protein V4691_05195 [Pseudomonadota bacterium]
MSSLPALKNDDYELIEAAVMETERGRWFLSEYAQRNRSSDTMSVLEAVRKLEASFSQSITAPDKLVQKLVSEMGAAFADLRKDLEILHHETEPKQRRGTIFEKLTDSVQLATQQILAATEDMQETSWAMRELGKDTDFCNRLDRSASDISLGCSLQDLNIKRITNVVSTLQALEKQTDLIAGLIGAVSIEATTPADLIAIETYSIEDIEKELFVEEAEFTQPQADNIVSHTAEPIQLSSFLSPHGLHEALANEWSSEDDGLLMDALQEETPGFDLPIRVNFTAYSFEEKIALFS